MYGIVIFLGLQVTVRFFVSDDFVIELKLMKQVQCCIIHHVYKIAAANYHVYILVKHNSVSVKCPKESCHFSQLTC